MEPSAFVDKAAEPKAKEVKKVLGKAGTLWDELRAWAAAEYEPLTETWKCPMKKWGWTLQLVQKKRTVLWLTPHEGWFNAGFVMGPKAVKAARAGKLSAAATDLLDNAPKYPEGYGIRIEVKSKRAFSTVKKLVAIKMGV